MSPPASSIVLVGLSGSGKSTLGPRLAAALDRPFVDTDDLIVRTAGRAIPDIFRVEGEAAFRAREAAAVAEALAGPPAVVSLGGGAILHPTTRVRCAGQVLLWLEAPPAVLARRVAPMGAAPDRPLLHGDPAARLAELLAQRRPYYAQAHLRLDASASPDVVLAAALAALDGYAPPAAHTLTVRTAAVPLRDHYDVISGRGVLGQLGALARARLNARRAFVITDSVAWPLLGALAEEALRCADLPWHVLPIPAGEANKTTAEAERLWGRLAKLGAERADPIIAVGGGVVGDLAGFVAATYVRGVPFVQVPTTLLAQVDSSIGGKVAVDHPLAKNIIGAFKAPDFVLVDTALLASLPPVQVSAGLAEVLKHGVVFDPALFEQLERGAEELRDLQPDQMLDAVRRNLAIKARVVEEDEFEHGPRMLLNYGHTLGHAIEAAAGYDRYLHGQAVSLGMVAEGWMAVQLGLLANADFARVERTLARLGLPIRAEGLDAEAVLAATRRDKKVRQGRLTWVLPTRLGEATRTTDVPPALAERALAYLASAALEG